MLLNNDDRNDTVGHVLAQRFIQFAHALEGSDPAQHGPSGATYSADELRTLSVKYNSLLKESLSSARQFFDTGTWNKYEPNGDSVAGDYIDEADRVWRFGSLREDMRKIVANPSLYPADYVVAAQHLLTTLDNAAQCAAASQQADNIATANSAVRKATGVARPVATDPRLALCPR